jgi:hypothetical protein
MIYITGDTHGMLDIMKLMPESFPIGEKLTREDYLIITGDFGGIWSGGKSDQHVLDFYRDKKYTILFVDGNHENFFELNQYDVEEWKGGKIHRIDDNIIHLMRGQVFEIEGKSIFTFGGGLSVDKDSRIPYLSWWPEEWPSSKEMDEALKNLKSMNFNVDYIITHAAPETLVRNEINAIHPLLKKDCETEKFLEEIYEKVTFNNWFCGHYHLDAWFHKQKLMVLSHDIIKLSDGYPIVSGKR